MKFVEFLKSWIYTIVVTMIFSAAVDLIIPGSSMRKYVKFVLGLVVMAAILQPVLKLAKADFNLSLDTFSYNQQLDQSYLKKQVDYYSEGQQAEIVKAYKKNLESNIKAQLEAEYGDGDIKVNVDVDEDKKSERFGEITKLNVSIGKQIKSVSKVEKVNLGRGENDKNNAKKESDNDSQNLKKKISSRYGIDPDVITISFIN